MKSTKVKPIKGTVECKDLTEIRGTGRSTVIALETIAYAIGHPLEWHKVEDHFSLRGNQKEQDRHLFNLICDICFKLNYNLEVDSQQLRIRSLHLGYKVVNGILIGLVEPKTKPVKFTKR
jgi:hypothetical protein